MSKANSGKSKYKDKKAATQSRQPWIKRSTGYTAMIVVSAALAVWVTWQTVRGGATIWSGILWGLGFGASLWLVFFGMNYFHSFFGGNVNKNKKKEN
jgi:hypothetical protein